MSTVVYFLTAFAIGVVTWAAFILLAVWAFNRKQRARDMQRDHHGARLNKHVLRRG